MRFLDSNIFIYAFYKPKAQLGTSEKSMKDSAKRVIADVSEGGEPVVTTVVHLSEVVNILKHGLAPGQLAEMLTGLLMLDNIDTVTVARNDYLAATELGRELDMDSNDALAVQVMRSKGLDEVYSFDKVFDRIEEITRLPNLG
jgi:predicted nucleic acid-binding protein